MPVEQETVKHGDDGIPVTADAMVAAARLLLMPRPRLKNLALGRELEVAELASLGAVDGDSALETLRRICGPAALCLRQAISLEPDHAEAHSLLAEIHEEFGHMSDSIVHRRRTLALRPDDEAERTALARALLVENQPDEAGSVLSASALAESEHRYSVVRRLGFEAWARQQDAPVTALSKASPLRYEFDVFLDGRHQPTVTEVQQRGISVAEVRSLTLLRGFVPVAANGTYIEGTVQDDRGTQLPGVAVAGGNFILADDLGTQETIDEPCIVLGGFPMHYENYFHAIAQNFIRLPLIMRQPEFATLPFAVSERIRPWGLDFLVAIGVSADRLIHVKHDRDTLIKRAFVPSPPTRIGMPSVDEARALRDALLARPVRPAPKDRLFISRGALPNPGRLLANEPALQDLAVQYGYQEVDPGAMSIAEQIDRFSQAAVICGSTGAGLTNMLYAPAQSAAVCFSPRETCRSYYLHLAAVARQRFSWCLGSFLPETRASRLFPHLPYTVEEQTARACFDTLEAGSV